MGCFPKSKLCRPQKSTTVTQRGPRGRTRGEARSRQSAPQLGLIGRSDACGVASARENSGVDQEGLAPKKSAVGIDCNAGTTTAEFSKMFLAQGNNPIQTGHARRQIQTPHQGHRGKAAACSGSAQTGHTSAERSHRRRTLTARRGDPCRADSGGPVSKRIGQAAQNSTTQRRPPRKGREYPFSHHPATHSQGHGPHVDYHLQKGALTINAGRTDTFRTQRLSGSCMWGPGYSAPWQKNQQNPSGNY